MGKGRDAPAFDRRALAEGCRRAARMLDGAIAKPPRELGEEVDEVERAVVRLRDGLIDRLRAADTADTADLRAALETINVSLSLIVGVEYSLGGIHRTLLAQARDTLRTIG